MRIAQLAPLVERIPPIGYGGIELVVSLLTEELIERGHEVTLFASTDSVTRGRLVSVVPQGLRKAYSELRYRWPAFDLRSLLKLREMQAQFDIVHNHMGYQALPFLQALNCPVVTTNHNLVSQYCADVFLAYRDLPFVAISDSYRRTNYPHDLNYVATIHNGIDLDKYAGKERNERKYLLFIGRVSHDKGTSQAIDIANRLGLPLKIAGKIDATDESYFLTEVKPKLSGFTEFIGEVNEVEKVKLYRGAIATVYPINFEEPFGLVMAESLASGTPVLALDRGAVREVVTDGESGLVANSLDELVERSSELQGISEEACRRRAGRLFSKERMTDEYELLYRELVRRFWNEAGRLKYEGALRGPTFEEVEA